MVRYPVGRQQLIDAIAAENPGWRDRAKARTELYEKARDYTGGSDFWGEIKQVYIELQHEKCAYCETKLQGAAYASKVHEVEHFRPKQSVKAWPNTRLAHLRGFVPPCATGASSAVGYYRLAYHPFNYAIACTRCNSTLKSNYFPVRGARDCGGADPSRMYGEGALLVYPISDIDDDPAELITFDGVLAVPRHAAGPAYERAVTTIHFFQLNHEDLTTRRASFLVYLWINLEVVAGAPPAALESSARQAVARACDRRSEFSACMSAFKEKFETDRAAADRMKQAAEALLPR